MLIVLITFSDIPILEMLVSYFTVSIYVLNFYPILHIYFPQP